MFLAYTWPSIAYTITGIVIYPYRVFNRLIQLTKYQLTNSNYHDYYLAFTMLFNPLIRQRTQNRLWMGPILLHFSLSHHRTYHHSMLRKKESRIHEPRPMKTGGIICIILGGFVLIANIIGLGANPLYADIALKNIVFGLFSIGFGIFLLNKKKKKDREKQERDKWLNDK